MTDRAIENARARHNELSIAIASYGRQIAEWKAEQERIEKFIEAWHEFAEMHTAADIDISSPPNGDIPPPKSEDDYGVVRRRRAVGNPKKEDVADAARQIIADRGEPVSRAELFKELAERGIEIRSDSDPEMVLSTMLWRMRDKVVRLKGGGYWLAERPWEPAGYDLLQSDGASAPLDANTEDQSQPDHSSAPMGVGTGKTDAELKADFEAIVASLKTQESNRGD
jgi:hypothetical protein